MLYTTSTMIPLWLLLFHATIVDLRCPSFGEHDIERPWCPGPVLICVHCQIEKLESVTSAH